MNENVDQPRFFLSGEVLQMHKRENARIAASRIRADQEIKECKCAICGAEFKVEPGIFPAYRYTCLHGSAA